jgi:hypothetical protein
MVVAGYLLLLAVIPMPLMLLAASCRDFHAM